MYNDLMDSIGFLGQYDSEVADAMIAVVKNGYKKPAIECRDISKLAKR